MTLSDAIKLRHLISITFSVGVTFFFFFSSHLNILFQFLISLEIFFDIEHNFHSLLLLYIFVCHYLHIFLPFPSFMIFQSSSSLFSQHDAIMFKLIVHLVVAGGKTRYQVAFMIQGYRKDITTSSNRR